MRSMIQARPCRLLSLTAIVLVSLWGIATPSRVWGRDDVQQSRGDDDGDDDNGGGRRHEGPCSGLHGKAFGLCVAFCEAQHCPEHPQKHSCEVLRAHFTKVTGSSTFPCEVTATPTGTAAATLTST